MSHRCRPIPVRRLPFDQDYGEYTAAEGDPRNDWRDGAEIYDDEVAAAQFAREMRLARKQQQEKKQP